jgi:hypothetical protein
MSWHDDLEEALVAMSVATFKGLAVCRSYYENYEDPNYWEDEHDKPKPTEIKDEAIGCMICNLHDKGADERAEDLAEMVKDLASGHELLCKTLKGYQKKLKQCKIANKDLEKKMWYWYEKYRIDK